MSARELQASALDAECTCITGLSGCGYPASQYSSPPSNDKEKWIAIAYATCVFIVFAFAAYAVLRYTVYMLNRKRDQDAEEFCTARGTQGPWRIAYSFFSSAVGAWCISSPSYFAVSTGILGLAMYSISSGLPILILAICGAHIVKRHKDIVSVSDFAERRFGPTMKTIVSLICLFTMSITLLGEYTTIGSLFSDFVGSMAWPMIITVGIVTMLYTIYGGLYISIITDQVQALATIAFITIMTIYVAVTFREPLPKPLPNDLTASTDPNGYQNWPLGVNKLGYSTIFSMPVALMSSTVFSEAIWQKVWASEDRRTMIFGGAVSFILITIAVFLFGFGGWLAAWAGLVTFDTNTNLYLFQVFASQRIAYVAPPFAPDSPLSPDYPSFPPLTPDAPPPAPPAAPIEFFPAYSAQLNSWIGAVVLILAVTMNEGLIDGMQNGLTSIVASHWFPNQNIFFARMIVVLINVPIMIVGCQKYTILQLYLIANMLTTCWFLPLLAGLWDCTTDFVGESGAIFGGCVAVLTSIAYSSGRIWDNTDDHLKAIQCGAWYAWYGAYTYDWDQFLAPTGASVVGMALWGGCAYLLKRYAGVEGPGVSGVLKHVPGFKFVTGHGLDYDLMDAIGLGRFNTKAAAPRTKDAELAEASTPSAADKDAVKEGEGDGATPNPLHAHNGVPMAAVSLA